MIGLHSPFAIQFNRPDRIARPRQAPEPGDGEANPFISRGEPSRRTERGRGRAGVAPSAHIPSSLLGLLSAAKHLRALRRPPFSSVRW